MDVGSWLRSLGLERYEAAFRENEIDGTILRRLTAEDLKDIGVGPVGHRRKLLEAIATLCTDAGVRALPDDAGFGPITLAEDHAERRQVTVMFSDLVDSTALSARMDPEDLRDVISAYQQSVGASVRRFGGFVAKYLGDGVLIYFGYPQAHEDDAERAVRAGLDLITAVSSLQSRARLQTRVGIATGMVVVGDLAESREVEQHGIVGAESQIRLR
jgi:class 3 adenylate cyclase